MPRTYLTPLQEIMVEEGRKNVWLAKRIGKDPSEVTRYLRGLHPDDLTKRAIANALGRQLSELGWEDAPVQETAA